MRVFLLTAPNASFSTAQRVVATFCSHPNHLFWPDITSYLDVPSNGIRGHKQLTDAYLAALARAHGGVLATMDKALAALIPDVVLI